MSARLRAVSAGDTNLEVIIMKMIFKAVGVMRSRKESASVRKKEDGERSPGVVQQSDPGQGKGLGTAWDGGGRAGECCVSEARVASRSPSNQPCGRWLLGKKGACGREPRACQLGGPMVTRQGRCSAGGGEGGQATAPRHNLLSFTALN